MRRAGLILAVALAACGSGGGGDDGSDDDGTTPDAAAELEPIHFVGRFDGDHRFAWPGSAILTRFRGTDLLLQLEEEGGANWYDVTVDGETSVLTTSGGMQTYAIATGLADGEHDVTVARRTESFYGISRFVGFTGGTLVDTPRPTRLIEFVGDSITCGYGILGPDQFCSFSADTEAETHAWGARAAAAVGAVHTAIAYSGIGVYRNYGGEPGTTMPMYYERTFADDPSSTWDWSYRPSAVVINLGTNDFAGQQVSDPGQPFVDAYAGFLEQIRGHYGADIPIFVTTSPMLADPDHSIHRGYLEQLSGVHIIDIATQEDADGYGCDWHPSETTAQKMATATVAALRAELGW